MSKDSHLLSGVGIFLAGAITAGLVTARRTEARRLPTDVSTGAKGFEEEQDKVTEREAALAARLAKIEARLEQHESRLAEMPSTQQIVSAMEQLITRMVTSLDERFKSQAQSIEVLKGTVTETDGLLERVLESLESLQSAEPLELTEDNLLERPAP